MEAFGRVDIVINNAGILRDRTLVKMEPSGVGRGDGCAPEGAYHVTRPAFLKMREGGYGRIVLTSSAAGLYGNFGQTNYSAAKMGLVGFMNTLKLEGERHNIKVNTVVPIAGTRLTEGVLPPELHEKLKPEFVAPLVLYLCSERVPGVTAHVTTQGMGCFNRAAIVTGPRHRDRGRERGCPPRRKSTGSGTPSTDWKAAREYPNAMAVYGPMLEAFGPKTEGGGGGRPDGEGGV